jgi:hypothetical protein
VLFYHEEHEGREVEAKEVVGAIFFVLLFVPFVVKASSMKNWGYSSFILN